MDATLICLARHGETDWNKRGILQGWTDEPINDLGRHKAHEVARAYAQENGSALESQSPCHQDKN
jgi:broad specificity phosphatase PhoE